MAAAEPRGYHIRYASRMARLAVSSQELIDIWQQQVTRYVVLIKHLFSSLTMKLGYSASWQLSLSHLRDLQSTGGIKYLHKSGSEEGIGIIYVFRPE